MRQVFYSLILATWYKKKIKDSILNKAFADQKKIKGLSSPDASIGDPETIYQQYLKAFKKGVFNYIKESPDPATGQNVPRKYFSGGVIGTPNIFYVAKIDPVQIAGLAHLTDVMGDVGLKHADRAMGADEERLNAAYYDRGLGIRMIWIPFSVF